MHTTSADTIIGLPELRDRIRVFRDRAHAGEILASMLASYRQAVSIVLAVPAGGVPVAAVIAEQLNLPFDMAVVSKITLPWNPEAGYGAVAFDGTVGLNDELVSRLGLTDPEVQQGVDNTRRKVERRVQRLRGDRPFPDLAHQTAILVDDGLASGFTLRVGVEALRIVGASRIIIAVPTGHRQALQKMRGQVEAIYCANIRHGWSFAVADAYEQWSDVSEEEVIKVLRRRFRIQQEFS